MSKEYTVKHGKNEYTRSALVGTYLIEFGCLVGNKFANITRIFQLVSQGSEVDLTKAINETFNKEEMKYFFDLFLNNEEVGIKVNGGHYLNCEEIAEHFAGDFIAMFSVVFQFIWCNLGKFDTLAMSTNELLRGTADYLSNMADNTSGIAKELMKKQEKKSQGKPKKI